MSDDYGSPKDQAERTGQRGQGQPLTLVPKSVTGHRFSFMERLNIGPAENVYLTRWYLISTPWGGVYLHHIKRPDADLDMHNHPWAFVGIVLKGGYSEFRSQGDFRPQTHVTHRPFRPWRFTLKDWHRIDQLQDSRKGSWSLILVGPRRRVWSFLTPKGEVPWTEYESVV